MNYRKSSILVSVIAVIMLLCSCTTTVTVSYMRPSKVNMGAYRNIAVASTVDASSLREPTFFIKTLDPISTKAYGKTFSTWSSSLSSSVAHDFTGAMERKLLDTGFFSVIGSGTTDKILDEGPRYRKELFRKKGIDAVIVPRIDSMNVVEWIRGVEKEVEEKLPDGTIAKKKVPGYFWEYEISLSWSYTIIDTATERLIAHDSFEETLSDSVSVSGQVLNISGFRNEFSEMVDRMTTRAVRDLVPARLSFTVSLMKDKSGIPEAEKAYEILEEGRYLDALDMLLEVWRSERSVPAGYNAALLIGGTGDFERAISLLDEVIRGGGGRDAEYLRADLVEALRSDRETEKQLSGEGLGEGSHPDIYELMGL